MTGGPEGDMAYSWVKNLIYNVVSLRVVSCFLKFSPFTQDIPPPLTGTHITYADDISQIIGYHGKSVNMAQRIADRGIERINKFEENWRIKTNKQIHCNTTGRKKSRTFNNNN